MGQKVNPISLRLGINRTWDSKWFAWGQKYIDNLQEDIQLRNYLKKKLKFAGVSKIEIERASGKVKLIVHTARPGIVIGKKGTGIDLLKEDLQKHSSSEVFLTIQEVRKPDTDAQLIAENICMRLEKRVSWRRVLKKAIAAAIRSGMPGIKIKVGGRLDGAEIARQEWYTEKSVPLHTLRANIDYGTAEALTTYGIIGVKVWVFKGYILNKKDTRSSKNVES